MTGKFLKQWVVVFIVLFIIDLIWHLFLVGGFLEEQLVGTQRYDAEGNLAPLIPFVILSDIIISFGYTFLVNMAAEVNKKYVLTGLITGLVIVGSYSVLNHAILPNWPLAVVAVDAVQGIVFGSIIGFVLGKLNRSKKAGEGTQI